MLKKAEIRSKIALGKGLGTTDNDMGTARSFEEGKLFGSLLWISNVLK